MVGQRQLDKDAVDRRVGVQPQNLAVDETVILLHPPLPLVGVSIVMMEKERQQNDSLVNGNL